MTRLIASALCILSLFHVASAQIRIMSPDWLVQQFPESKGGIQGSTATFGAPFYGDRVLGRVLWAESLKGKHHCTDDDYDIPQADKSLRGERGDGSLINIVMVRRGQCSFTTKARIAASKGAHAVIIVDREDSKLTARDLHHIIVADDGYGGNIRVPSVLISKDDGARLIEAAKRGSVVTELKWDIPANHVVEMDLWMSSGSPASMQFLKDFSAKRKSMNQVVKFRPHYAVFSVPSSDPSIYRDLCSDSSGQFCAEEPDSSGIVKGKEVLEEDVRQLCIHELTKVVRTSYADIQAGKTMVEYAEKYWDYVEKFVDECPISGAKADGRFGTQCSERLMRKVGLDVAKVQQCISSSKERKLKEERENTAWSPRALRINGWRYSGMMNADLVTRAICSGFISQPSECTEILKQPSLALRGGDDSTVTWGTLFGCLFTVAFFGLSSFKLYQWSVKKEINADVREQVFLEVQSRMAEYGKMSDF